VCGSSRIRLFFYGPHYRFLNHDHIFLTRSQLLPGVKQGFLGLKSRWCVIMHPDGVSTEAKPKMSPPLRASAAENRFMENRILISPSFFHHLDSIRILSGSMVLGILTAIAACPAIIGTTEAVRQGQRQNAREKHRGLKTNLAVACSRATKAGREIDGCEMVLSENKV
jgi:hypothetical protein